MKKYFITFFLLIAVYSIMAQQRVYTPIPKAPDNGAINQMPNVSLSWYAITGSLNLQYEVVLDTSSTFSSTLKVDTIQTLLAGYKTRNLMFGVMYYWKVRAIDNGDTSYWSPVRSFTVFNSLEFNKPALNDTAQNPNATITWNSTISNVAITGVTNYDYQIDTTTMFTSPLLVSGSVNSSTFSFTNQNLRFGTSYYWRVKARHSTGSSGFPYVWVKQKSLTANDLNKNQMIDANTGYAIGKSGTILKTTNSGTTWASQTSGTTNNLNGLHFFNTSLGLAVGDAGTILKGKGSAWSTLTSGVTQNLHSVYVISANVGVAVGDNGIILKTVNADTTWTAKTSGTTNALLSIHFPKPATGFTVGVAGTILTTSDTASNWQAQTSGTTKDLTCVYFNSLTYGIAVGKTGTILRTTNGGTTWTTIPSGTTNDLMAVYLPDSKNGYIAGANGTLLKTINGGLYWFPLVSGVSNDLNSISFINVNTGTAVGKGGTIIITTTAGTPWNFRVLAAPTLSTPINNAVNQTLDVILQWTKITGILAYRYQIARDIGFTDLVFASEIDTMGIPAAYLGFGTKYYWKVSARHISDTSNWSIPFNFTTYNSVILKSPANEATNVDLKPLLEWNKQTGIEQYQLQLDSTTAFTNPIVSVKPTSTEVKYQVLKKLLPLKTYYWRMREFAGTGGAADTSAWSAVWSFTTLNTIGIEENGITSITMYPNPATNRIFIKLDSRESRSVQFTLIDFIGKIVMEKQFGLLKGENEKEISLSSIGRGIYIVRLTFGNSTVNQRIVIEK
ncbi:MAG: YCF48-related protein [Bacteroidetes bacterium]|nr:YCF48-related protein [Bacteroidota bacterium]